MTAKTQMKTTTEAPIRKTMA